MAYDTEAGTWQAMPATPQDPPSPSAVPCPEAGTGPLVPGTDGRYCA